MFAPLEPLAGIWLGGWVHHEDQNLFGAIFLAANRIIKNRGEKIKKSKMISVSRVTQISRKHENMEI